MYTFSGACNILFFFYKMSSFLIVLSVSVSSEHKVWCRRDQVSYDWFQCGRVQDGGIWNTNPRTVQRFIVIPRGLAPQLEEYLVPSILFFFKYLIHQCPFFCWAISLGCHLFNQGRWKQSIPALFLHQRLKQVHPSSLRRVWPEVYRRSRCAYCHAGVHLY